MWRRALSVAAAAPLISRLGAGLVAAVAVFALWQLPSSYRNDSNQAAANERRTQEERQILGGLAIDIDRDYLVQAQRLVPRNARYSVQIGENVALSTPITLPAVPGYTQFLLSPRRQTRAETATWLLCYGCDFAQWRGRYVPVWEKDGILIGRVRR